MPLLRNTPRTKCLSPFLSPRFALLVLSLLLSPPPLPSALSRSCRLPRPTAHSSPPLPLLQTALADCIAAVAEGAGGSTVEATIGALRKGITAKKTHEVQRCVSLIAVGTLAGGSGGADQWAALGEQLSADAEGVRSAAAIGLGRLAGGQEGEGLAKVLGMAGEVLGDARRQYLLLVAVQEALKVVQRGGAAVESAMVVSAMGGAVQALQSGEEGVRAAVRDTLGLAAQLAPLVGVPRLAEMARGGGVAERWAAVAAAREACVVKGPAADAIVEIAEGLLERIRDEAR